MNKKYIVLTKKVGETPLSLLDKFRDKNTWIGDKKLAYAGRLDPMASGKVLVLIGDECKKQDSYLGLDKEYEFEVLFGFSSDSGDVLGLAEYDTKINTTKLTQLNTLSIKKFIGKISMPFPKFSSKTVDGKPLFLWTLEGRLGEIEMPIKNSTIYKLKEIGARKISSEDLHKSILEKINSIPKITDPSKALGEDFRRNDIRAKWNELFKQALEKEFQIIKFSCTASSGTYMRSLAEEIGKSVGVKSLAYSIHRTKIGRYKQIFKNFGFWVNFF